MRGGVVKDPVTGLLARGFAAIALSAALLAALVFAAMVGAALFARPAIADDTRAAAGAAAVAATHRLSGVVVTIPEDAVIDWYARESELYPFQTRFITQIFQNGARDGEAGGLSGLSDAEMRIEVVQFDILSEVEKLFCCAKNEVSAYFELVDVGTGDPLTGRTLLNFDHFGVGGVLGLLSSAGGDDQISRLTALIGEGVAEWIAAGGDG